MVSVPRNFLPRHVIPSNRQKKYSQRGHGSNCHTLGRKTDNRYNYRASDSDRRQSEYKHMHGPLLLSVENANNAVNRYDKRAYSYLRNIAPQIGGNETLVTEMSIRI